MPVTRGLCRSSCVQRRRSYGRKYGVDQEVEGKNPETGERGNKILGVGDPGSEGVTRYSMEAPFPPSIK